MIVLRNTIVSEIDAQLLPQSRIAELIPASILATFFTLFCAMSTWLVAKVTELINFML